MSNGMAIREVHQHVGRNDRPLRIGAAALKKGGDPIADPGAGHIRPEFRHSAEYLYAEHQRIGSRVRINASTFLGIRPVAASVRNIDQNLTSTDDRFRYFSHDQLLEHRADHL